MKRAAATAGASGSEPLAQRRKVKHGTYQKWVSQYDRNCQTMAWLDCDTAIERGVKLVTKLKCRVCAKYKDKIQINNNIYKTIGLSALSSNQP